MPRSHRVLTAGDALVAVPRELDARAVGERLRARPAVPPGRCQPLAADGWTALLIGVPQGVRCVAAVSARSAGAAALAAAGLTPREREALVLALAGRTNAQIEDDLGCSASTLRTHLKKAQAKLALVRARRDAPRQAKKVAAALAPGERELLRGLAHSPVVGDLASHLGLRPSTCGRRLAAILKKLGIAERGA